ncbi:MAG: PQQ-binding-like beta-propeller repeat protein [Planctomycetota bacterium]|nr:PQQ-binding-like beta-propeller repeat protein [Planctomycetota bacterium]
MRQVCNLMALIFLVTSSNLEGGARPHQEAIEDPAPPVVAELEPMEAPVARPYPELRFIESPIALSKGAVTEDWPCFMGLQHSGHSRETKLRKTFDTGEPQLVWAMQSGLGFACPVIANGKLIYTHRVGNETHVDCLDPETGQRYWRYSYPCEYKDRYISNNGPRSTPIIDGDRVYTHGVAGRLHCLDLATGRVIWQRDLAKEYHIPQDFFGVVASPIIHGDLLIQNIGAPPPPPEPGGPSVAAFDKRTGQLVWGAGSEWGPSCASPIIATVHGRDRLFVIAGGDSRPPVGGLMVMDPKTGKVDFAYPFRSRAQISVLGASPIVGDGRVFITASYNTGTAGLALHSDGGFTELWKTRRVGMQFSNPIYVDGHLYAIDGHSDRVGSIICFAPGSGEVLSRTDLTWEEVLFYRGEENMQPLSIGEGSLLHVDGATMCLGDNGHLLWLEMKPEGTRVISRVSLFRANESWTPPVLSRGLLYVRQNTKERFGQTPAPPRLMCFDLRDSELTE